MTEWKPGDIIPATSLRPEMQIESIDRVVGEMAFVKFVNGTKGAIPLDKNGYLQQLSEESNQQSKPEQATPTTIEGLIAKWDNEGYETFPDLVDDAEILSQPIVTGKDRKSTRLNSSHSAKSRMPSSA